MFDDTIVVSQVHDYLQCARPNSYFYNPGSSGGWAPGAAFGAKLAARDRNVVAITGDGFYMFATAIHSLWSAAQYKAPYLTIVYQNRSYSTGTLRVSRSYPDGFAAKAGYPGGYFEPPIDFAAEARSAGAYGENVTDPKEVGPALQRGMKSVRRGNVSGHFGLVAAAAASRLGFRVTSNAAAFRIAPRVYCLGGVIFCPVNSARTPCRAISSRMNLSNFSGVLSAAGGGAIPSSAIGFLN